MLLFIQCLCGNLKKFPLLQYTSWWEKQVYPWPGTVNNIHNCTQGPAPWPECLSLMWHFYDIGMWEEDNHDGSLKTRIWVYILLLTHCVASGKPLPCCGSVSPSKKWGSNNAHLWGLWLDKVGRMLFKLLWVVMTVRSLLILLTWGPKGLSDQGLFSSQSILKESEVLGIPYV